MANRDPNTLPGSLHPRFSRAVLPGILILLIVAILGAGFHLSRRDSAMVHALRQDVMRQRARADYWRHLALERGRALARLETPPRPATLMQQSLGAATTPSSFPPIGADTLYQGGKPVGTAGQVRVNAGEGMIIFGEIQVSTKFNINADFAFGPYLLHHVPNPLPPGTPGGEFNQTVSFGPEQIAVFDNFYARIVGKHS